MTIPALRKLAAIYGCPVTQNTVFAFIHNPTWDSQVEITHESLVKDKPRDIIPILERLSGKKTVDLWKAGKP